MTDLVVVDKQIECDYRVLEIKGNLALCGWLDTKEWFEISRLTTIEIPAVAGGYSLKNEGYDTV